MTEYEKTLEYIKNLTKFGINLGLERIKALLDRLDHPEKKLKVIHIGGTNGKGSTTAMLQSIMTQAGYRAGMFTSPHLHDFRERITINGEMISPEDVVSGINKLKPHLEEMERLGIEHPTEFEVCTALALCYFAEKQPDLVLLEVGLGGEIDSTNVVTPLISVLTSIGMDHMDYLGDTLQAITGVKAGIIKDGVPVVTSSDKPEVLKVIEERAAQKGSRMIEVGRDVHWRHPGDGSQRFGYEGLCWSYPDLELALLGEHQFTNAAAALAVCEVLVETYSLDISESAVREGLKAVRWPGRLELLLRNPRVLLDGAHNADGMMSLAKALQQYAGGPLKRNRLLLCLGMLRDKEIEKAVEIIAPLADEIIVTKPDSPRAGDWEYVARIAEKYLTQENVLTVEDPAGAVRKGLEIMKSGDLLCVTGSLYMISGVRKFLLDHYTHQE
ncbi:Dihydrofolate synthase [Dehalobacter sp. UNSWDHB]|jgi:folylpolyglutamate synthase/dihydrofolate synthase|uniref:bifunctional folylpolyglutamate synthase/dihydrofolate synthase n=1 Tax=unclassified Dehalobacter TaxID=2635733 RepID=UPI00028B56EA|nr:MULTISPECIES: folylpolyglutamate synthase/dihydrofolate synthase family protein [unclassified Dehalobacter]AFV03639.1 Dihydrofolate synthase / Folylpolyglutamate synthase [Dehalobacter sp. DCA]AFV06626.1 Dihydrofolate synthase / Folylpolyglutamate synthase [Dehalobacter sp. CF]EQB20332.1 Dihydrofolate synthase [Dehalobacter sp. UNSWDHB]